MKLATLPFLIAMTLVSVAQADTVIADSSRLDRADYLPIQKSYVLASGVYNLQCEGGHGKNCQIKASEKQCMEGYKPSVNTSVVEGGPPRICAVRYIYMDPQPANLIPSEGVYQLALKTAYIAGSTKACGKYPLTINYTIYCNPSPISM